MIGRGVMLRGGDEEGRDEEGGCWKWGWEGV